MHQIGSQEAKASFSQLLRDEPGAGQSAEEAVLGLLNFRTKQPCDDISLDEVRQAMREGRR